MFSKGVNLSSWPGVIRLGDTIPTKYTGCCLFWWFFYGRQRMHWACSLFAKPTRPPIVKHNATTVIGAVALVLLARQIFDVDTTN